MSTRSNVPRSNVPEVQVFKMDSRVPGSTVRVPKTTLPPSKMSSFAEIYQHESTETKTIPGRTGLLTYTINLREWGYRGPEYLGTCLRGAVVLGGAVVPPPDTTGQFVNYGGHRYRRVGMGVPLQLGWLHPRYTDDSPSKLFVRERRGTKEQVRQMDFSLRQVGEGARAETWLNIAERIGEPVFLVVDANRPDTTYTETLLTAVSWTPAVVVYFGVESQWRADPHGRVLSIYPTPHITHWSPTKTERCPHVFLYDPRDPHHPFNFHRPNEVADERLRGVDWKDHCEHRLVASKAQVRMTRVAGGATRRQATPYEFVYPPVFLAETAGAGVAPLDERGTGVYDIYDAQAHARALALLERERKRRLELFRELAEAVFSPARLERMMERYGEDWMERV